MKYKTVGPEANKNENKKDKKTKTK